MTNSWNVFEDGDVGTAENSDSNQTWNDILTRAANAQICDAAHRPAQPVLILTMMAMGRPLAYDALLKPISVLEQVRAVL